MPNLLKTAREQYIVALVNEGKKARKSARRKLHTAASAAHLSLSAIEELFEGANHEANRIKARTMTAGVPAGNDPRRRKKPWHQMGWQQRGFAHA